MNNAKFLVTNFTERLRGRLDSAFIKDNVIVKYNDFMQSIDIMLYRVEGKVVFRYDCPVKDIVYNDSGRVSDLLERLTCYCINDYKELLACEAIRGRVKEC
jgi:hypothetical protein